MKFLFRFLKYLAFFLLSVVALIGIYLGIGALLPQSQPQPSRPFAGDAWHNPYQELGSPALRPQAFNANFHAHSNAWGLVANGRKNSPERIHEVYRALGFDIIGISDYQSIQRYRDTAPDYIPIYEHGYNFKKAHQLSLGAHRVTGFDGMALQNLRVKQYFLHLLKKRTVLLCINHPSKWGGYSAEELRQLSGYDLIEVLNHYGDAEMAWDIVLSEGRQIYLLANDDSHDVSLLEECGRKFTRVISADTRAENVLMSLKKGLAYGVDMPVLPEETFEQKGQRIRHLPELLRLEVVGDSLFFQMSEPFSKGEAIGDKGAILYSHGPDSLWTLALPDKIYSYLRLKIYGDNGLIYYFNPITRKKA